MDIPLHVFDANILIDADKLQLAELLPRWKVRKCITDLCWAECTSVASIALGDGMYDLRSVNTTDHLMDIIGLPISAGCSIRDKSALWLAEREWGTLLTGDKLLRAEAERRKCKVRGLLGLIQQLWSARVISSTLALSRLRKLKENGQGFRVPVAEIDKLIHEIEQHR